tara:strand:+ start:11834 stop:13096 length:1263 start_codon:yes stop_codon:yes gene_type:complete
MVMKILIPIFSDAFLHPLHKDNDLSLLYVRHVGDSEGRMICINHPDCGDKESIDEIVDDHNNFYITPDVKKIKHIFPNTRLIDVNYLHWWDKNIPLDLENIRVNAYDFFHSKYYNAKKLNEIIPFTKHKEYCDKVFDEMIKSFSQVNDSKYHSDVIEAFSSIEKHGIKITDDVCDVFDERVRKHISNGKLYSQYNLWTSTGRPSNSFGSVNFAALPPEKRSVFIPQNDTLVEYDFDAYHLRLIGELVDYKFDDESVHQHLADFYGSTYEESKQISFKLLYGGITEEIRKKVPFFDKVQDFINLKWSEFNDRNYILTDIYNRKITKSNNDSMNKNKLFNYLIQSLETEKNITKILKLKEYLEDKQTNLILYGYDSFLFDFSKNDGVNTLSEVKTILEEGNYLTKIKMGYTYSKLDNITKRL